MKKQLLHHSLAFFLSLFICIFFLLLGACLPQSPIDANVRKSAEKMVTDGCYPVMADKSYASMLDRYTDALILSESKSTTISQWDTIFTNPLHEYGDNPVQDLYAYSMDNNPQPTDYYTQYWMGFRPIIRLLLCFFDYYQIIRYNAAIFFILFTAVLCSLAKHTNTKVAFLFALSIIIMRPHIISVSLQFSCCFYIAFLAMLLVPWIHKTKKWESVFFLQLGILTQYFDFYTTPILTFGLPMIYLYVLEQQSSHSLILKRIGRNTCSWSFGYAFMWLAKLVLTSLLTNANGLEAGFSSFSSRIGIEKAAGLESYYSPVMAIRTVYMSLYSDPQGKIVLFLIVAIVILVLAFRFFKNKCKLHDLKDCWPLLLLAAFPVVWFMVAAQPTSIHHWFQYRSIAVSFWAGFLWLCFLTDQKSCKTISS